MAFVLQKQGRLLESAQVLEGLLKSTLIPARQTNLLRFSVKYPLMTGFFTTQFGIFVRARPLYLRELFRAS